MHHKSCILAAGLSSALAAKAAPYIYARQEASLPAVQANTLVDLVDEAYLRTGAETLQRIADENNGTRAFGTTGHFAGLEWIESQLNETDAYDVTRQYFEAYQYTPLANSTFVVNGQPAMNFTTPEFSPNGTASGSIVYSGLGCEASSFPTNVTGQIALIDRGTCEFGLKASLAAAAGATGAIIADNVIETADLPPASVTLGEPTRPEGPYVPVVAISYNYGQQLRNASATGVITVSSSTELTETYNILAETRGGDKDNIVTVGAHTDSVLAGPGINDDGSGTVAILHIARAMANYSATNAVRFGFWSAEESGLLGSTAYVASLNQSEITKIRMNLNFDMLASPNGVYMIYDGDGSTYNLTGPDGSAQIETVFESFYTAANLSFRATEFDGRSDYGPFLEIGIPAGGLFSGAEEVKTEEEAAIWGGTAGVAYDVNYHKAGDDINNLNYRDWVVNTKAAAFAVGTYAGSLESFPANNATAVVPNRKRDMAKRAAHTHAGTYAHGGGCGPKAIE